MLCALTFLVLLNKHVNPFVSSVLQNHSVKNLLIEKPKKVSFFLSDLFMFGLLCSLCFFFLLLAFCFVYFLNGLSSNSFFLSLFIILLSLILYICSCKSTDGFWFGSIFNQNQTLKPREIPTQTHTVLVSPILALRLKFITQ